MGDMLNGIAPTADFELDSTPPVAAMPQALLFQPQAEYVSLALLGRVLGPGVPGGGRQRYFDFVFFP